MKVKEILQNNSEWIPNKNYDKYNPKVSVLLPTFRRAKDGFFERAVMSVLNQTFKNLELIIIDDASTDGTKDLIKYFMETDERVHCIRHRQNIGLPAISEYEGYMKSRGEYISFIFDDNEWDKEYIEKTIVFMIREKVKASFGVVKSYFGEKKKECVILGNPKVYPSEMNEIFITNFIGNAGVVLHKDVIEDIGLYDPHISLKRICDWDLWRRIFQKYDFEFTGVNASSEYGVTLKDSLGNTENLDLWVGLEQMSEDRNELLKPKSFLEYDIFSVNRNNTLFFLDTIEEEIQNYRGKHWFNDEKSKKEILEIKNMEKRNTKKRILVISPLLDATSNVSFIRYNEIFKDIVFYFESERTLKKDNLIFVDAIIFMRDLDFFQKIKKLCDSLKIPYYYYIDDNFIILTDDIKNKKIIMKSEGRRQIEKFASNTKKLSIYGFKKVFCSTEELKKYFLENNLHHDIEVLNPIIDFKNIFRHEMKKESISIAFMGGNFRNGILKEIILPAIIRLSKDIKVKFYYPENGKKDFLKIYNDEENLNFYSIERTFSLQKALRRFAKNEIDILIHCGEEINNGIYKTENSLLNAVQLGAVLVTSNIEPYKSKFKSKNEYVRVTNEINDWYIALKSLAQNSEIRENIYNKAYFYCKEKYSGEKEEKILKNALSEFKDLRNIDFIKRYRKFLVINEEIFKTKFEKPRSLTDRVLNFSGLIKNKRSYNIKCDIKIFKTLGLLFASYDEPKGNVIVRIIEKNNILREISLNMEDFIRDNWTYLNFDPIKNSLNKIFEIQIEFFYEKGSVLMGVFEDTEKRTFKYKLFNKLGYPIKGLDVLYVDCK
ncbi:glycosyltransferase family 2 protein [Leptotrichia sp. OH3620_COT-345]|uniref:glycosyltransferase n=1 Tax=Leptotrichia sp. OH3620_COT-345 TaxID=2491048 RepID=UPI000F64CB9D|nr:glycosyltransferase [Leptotrichia sp. OH3620_COT-345]RRD40749.1 glycosyltransferase family 2 protein [Leptotrichia sp. OH3620_COT-345]